MGVVDCSDEELQAAIESLRWFQTSCWRYSYDASAARALARIRGPVMELMGYVVQGVLEEMLGRPNDPEAQSMGVFMLSGMIKGSDALKRVVRSGCSVQVLMSAVQQHPNDEALLAKTLEAIDELHGVPSLLQALDRWKGSPLGVRAALGAFSTSAKARWKDVQELPAHDLVRVVLAALEAHREDYRITSIGIELLGDMTWDIAETRAAFASLGGWEWLFKVQDAHTDDPKIQRFACRLLSALSRGGSFAECHSVRALQQLERAMSQHESNEAVLYWSLWAVQQLNGARALVAPMRSGCFKTPSTMVAALKCMGRMSLGQGDGGELGDMPAVIDAVLHAMRTFSERFDVLLESTIVLGRVTSFVVAACNDAAAPPQLFASVEIAVDALVQLMDFRLPDAKTVFAACEAIVLIVEACREDSPVLACFRSRLFDPTVSGSEALVPRIIAAHVSNDYLQAALMWLTGAIKGVAAVLGLMAQHPASHDVQLPGIKTLAWLHSDRIELEAREYAELPEALRAVVAAMSRFPENIVLQQYGCFALGSIVEHGETSLNEGVFTAVATAATEALKLVKGCEDARRDCQTSWNALFLRKEATRCVGVLCRVRPVLGRWLRDQGLQDILEDALLTTADGVWDGRRDHEAEEVLYVELLALSYVRGPSAILGSLRRWGVPKPAVARAAADAVVELARASASSHTSADTSDPSLAFCARPVETLSAAGCGAELIRAMQAHKDDEELQGRLHLAIGFLSAANAVAVA